MTIRLKLHVILAEKRLQQKDLSESTGIRPGTIGNYCNDTAKNINRDHLNKICNVLKVTPNDLIEYIPD